MYKLVFFCKITKLMLNCDSHNNFILCRTRLINYKALQFLIRKNCYLLSLGMAVMFPEQAQSKPYKTEYRQ